jgi:murein DD-endopeptidase MepM/ murein hydrolase activator NlpD
VASFRKKISTKFKNRYRVVLRDDENLEEKISIVLTPWRMLIGLCAGLFLFGTIVYLLLAYTPLNYLFPTKSAKYSSLEQYAMIQKIDSLETMLMQLNLQSDVLGKVLAGEDIAMDQDIVSAALATMDEVLEQEDEGTQIANSGRSVRPAEKDKVNYSFFIPLKGVISDSFNLDRKHLGIDIVANSRDVIKSAQKGTVIFAAWTPSGGHTMLIQHPNDFISIYKHNAVLLKKEGTFVNAGDAVALVGNTGELTSGPHLHFELWKKGVTVNPLNFINF